MSIEKFCKNFVAKVKKIATELLVKFRKKLKQHYRTLPDKDHWYSKFIWKLIKRIKTIVNSMYYKANFQY